MDAVLRCYRQTRRFPLIRHCPELEGQPEAPGSEKVKRDDSKKGQAHSGGVPRHVIMVLSLDSGVKTNRP